MAGQATGAAIGAVTDGAVGDEGGCGVGVTVGNKTSGAVSRSGGGRQPVSARWTVGVNVGDGSSNEAMATVGVMDGRRSGVVISGG